ncbi:MAG: hypothetical protein CMQ24_08420 [Gammaproteobacteria bacterium]|nr:hypothetical protein [Gammaproteobacteria bacterium]
MSAVIAAVCTGASIAHTPTALAGPPDCIARISDDRSRPVNCVASMRPRSSRLGRCVSGRVAASSSLAVVRLSASVSS